MLPQLATVYFLCVLGCGHYGKGTKRMGPAVGPCRPLEASVWIVLQNSAMYYPRVPPQHRTEFIAASAHMAGTSVRLALLESRVP